MILDYHIHSWSRNESLCVLNKISKTSLENLKITKQNCSLQKLLTMKLFKQACQQLGIENKRRKRLSQFNNNAIKSVTFVAVITVFNPILLLPLFAKAVHYICNPLFPLVWKEQKTKTWNCWNRNIWNKWVVYTL